MKHKLNILLVLVGLLPVSCEKSLSIDLPETEGRVVLYSFVYPDSLLTLQLSRTAPITASKPFRFVQNAHFEVQINNQMVLIDSFPNNQLVANWNMPKINAGDSISVTVYTDGFPKTFAHTRVLQQVPILLVDTLTEYRLPGNTPHLRFRVGLKDPLGENNYYQVLVVRRSIDKETSQERVQTLNLLKEDPAFSMQDQAGGISNWFDFRGLFSDHIFDGSTYRVNFLVATTDFAIKTFEQQVNLEVYLYHHTPDYFEYLKTSVLSKGANNFPVFDPIRIHTNVTNGLGLLSGMVFDKRTLSISALESSQ